MGRIGYKDRELLATPGTLVHVAASIEHWCKFDSDGAPGE
jgi:hypothetical protein